MSEARDLYALSCDRFPPEAMVKPHRCADNTSNKYNPFVAAHASPQTQFYKVCSVHQHL